VHVALGNELTLETTFLIFSFVSIIRFPLLLIPHAFSLYFEVSPLSPLSFNQFSGPVPVSLSICTFTCYILYFKFVCFNMNAFFSCFCFCVFGFFEVVKQCARDPEIM
jgi:hypothetical protein